MTATAGLWPTPGCFDDVRVLEIGDEKGEYAGYLLSGEGADVLKIEPPEGSPSRRIGPFYQDKPDPERSLFFWQFNRGKRGVSLNLADPADRATYLALVGTADVVIDARGLGVMDELALGYDRVREARPDVIYCSITPFGLTGPWRDFKATDLIHQALGGSSYCCGYNQVAPGIWDTPPMTPRAWHSFTGAGEQASLAIAAALFYRQASGEGQFIDVAIHDACAQSTEGTVPRYIYYQSNQVRRLPDQLECGDGLYLNFAPSQLWTVNFPKLLAVLKEAGLADELDDPKYLDGDFRRAPAVANQIGRAIARWAATQPAVVAFQVLQDCRVMCGPMRPPEDLLTDPHCQARDNFVEVHHPELGETFSYPRQPRRQTETPWRWGRRAPLIGEHNRMVREELDARKAAR